MPKCMGIPRFDTHLYNWHLTEKEKIKHAEFEKNVALRESILASMTADDMKQLIIAEDELSRTNSTITTRLFPRRDMGKYIKYFDGDTYYYHLFNAWETMYGNNREAAVLRLTKELEIV